VDIHGAKVISSADAPILEVQNLPTASKVVVAVHTAPGRTAQETSGNCERALTGATGVLVLPDVNQD
jgi:hypothetical protein